MASLYDTDYQRWLDQTVAQLRAHEFDNLDLENLIEEIESLGKSDKRAIASYLMRLCEHLLKLKYWEAKRETYFRGWDLEIENFRDENFLSEHKSARKLFLKASRLDADRVPEKQTLP